MRCGRGLHIPRRRQTSGFARRVIWASPWRVAGFTASRADLPRGARHSDAFARSRLKHVKAEQTHREVHAVRKRVLGSEHPDTLMSANNLASTRYSPKKHAEVELIHREVFDVRKRVLGAEHRNTLASANNLASTLSRQRK